MSGWKEPHAGNPVEVTFFSTLDNVVSIQSVFALNLQPPVASQVPRAHRRPSTNLTVMEVSFLLNAEPDIVPLALPRDSTLKRARTTGPPSRATLRLAKQTQDERTSPPVRQRLRVDKDLASEESLQTDEYSE